MKRIFHMAQSVRGALRNWRTPRDYPRGYLTENGRELSFDEAINVMMEELSKGREVLPLGDPCEGFDYKTGCPGHDEEGEEDDEKEKIPEA